MVPGRGDTTTDAASPQAASLTAQGNAGFHLTCSAGSTVCSFQRLTASSLEKEKNYIYIYVQTVTWL